VKDVGEPGDQKGHARFDGGRLETGTTATVAELSTSVGNAWDERRDLQSERTAPVAYLLPEAAADHRAGDNAAA